MKHDVLCTECARPVHDSLSLCELCCKAFTDDLRSIPGLFADLIVTEARLDRISTGRSGGKSAETPIPIRITGKVKDEPWRDTKQYPYEHSGRDDRIQTRHPHDQLVTTLIKWGNTFQRRYPRDYRIGAPGLINIALQLRVGKDERDPQPPVTRLEFNDDTKQLESVVKRPASRGDVHLITVAPVTESEQIAVWIAHNPQYVRTFEAAHTMIADITKAIIKVRLVIDRRPDLRYIGPCPTCSNELRAEPGEQWVRCRRCNEQHEITKVIRAAMKRIEDNLYPMPQISQYLELLDRPVPLVTLHSWHYRGRLRKRGWLHTDPRTGQKTITKYWLHRNDPPVFRLGDVLRIVERQTARTTGTGS